MKKTHIKIKGKPACNVKGKKLQYTDLTHEPTCQRCIKAIER